MGVIRWTPKGLQLTGPIFTVADMNAWLRYSGREAYTKASEQLWGRWFLNDQRTRRRLFRRLSKAVNASGVLQLALQESLQKLPSLIGKASGRIEMNGPTTLGASNNSGWLAIVPRAFVRNVYSRILMKDLAASAELEQFDGLPNLFLTKKAMESENIFFTLVNKQGYYVNSSSGMIFSVDTNFDWNWGTVAGHYYYGESTRLDKILTKRRDRKGFEASMKGGLERKQAEIQVLNQQRIKRIVESLRH
ncbi:MAG: hypothetical protein ACE5K1_06765 [Acidiferrobacterales bacterium]